MQMVNVKNRILVPEKRDVVLVVPDRDIVRISQNMCRLVPLCTVPRQSGVRVSNSIADAIGWSDIPEFGPEIART